jgi:Predicted nucleic acid-binding protein, contains PIN domain
VIVLDSNVVSELMRSQPEPRVLAWVDAQQPRQLVITAVTAAELRYGVARLPCGRRRTRLAADLEALITEDFAQRVLPFTVESSAEYADVVDGRDRVGRPISTSDAQIAAICRTRDAALATRNTADFEGCGVELIDPWQS